MPLNIITIIINAIFLLMALFFSFRLLRAGSQFQYNVGNAQVQEKMKWIILRCIVILVFLGVIAAIFNLVIFFLPTPTV